MGGNSCTAAVEKYFETEVALAQVCEVAEIKGTFERILNNVKHDPRQGGRIELKVEFFWKAGLNMEQKVSEKLGPANSEGKSTLSKLDSNGTSG